MARFTINGQDVNVEQVNETSKQVIVLLHGFTGSTATWAHVVKHLPAWRLITVDLIGHGKSAAPEEVAAYSMELQIDVLEELFQQLKLEKIVLLGYSMGGRVALSYTVKYPVRVKQLILESASPGLRSVEDRAARKLADEQLANKIEQNGILSFVERWENIQLFASQKLLPVATQQEIRAERLAQRTIGLANSLRGMGTGVMPSVWDALNELTMPVTLITGKLDEKFEDLAQVMQQQLRNCTHISVNGAGHAIHVENPAKFATIVKETI